MSTPSWFPTTSHMPSHAMSTNSSSPPSLLWTMMSGTGLTFCSLGLGLSADSSPDPPPPAAPATSLLCFFDRSALSPRLPLRTTSASLNR